MRSTRLWPPLLAYALLILAWTYQLRVSIPQLPDPVISHFDFSGRPDGTMGLESFRTFSILLQGGLAVFFPLLAALIPRIPAGLINIPHSEYWLSEERRQDTLAFMTRILLWIGALTFAFTLMVFQATINVNLSPGGTLGRQFWISMGFYMGAMILLVVKIYERFGRVPESMRA